MEDTQPNPSIPSPPPLSTSADEIETGEVPGTLGDPTLAVPRVPTGATPTAHLPRPVPPPMRPGYVPPTAAPHRPADENKMPAPPSTSSPAPKRSWGKVAVRLFFVTILIGVLLFFTGVGAAIVGYIVIARQLPPPEELQTRQIAFVSSKILDREGRLLYEVTDPEGGRRTYVPIDHISEYLIDATVATEDRNFWLHPGFDPIAILRAIYYALTEQEIVSGFSTITQQVARNVLLSPEERFQRTVWRKVKEVVLAAELTRVYPKTTILEVYLNENYYGNLAYGVQAAAETYFGTDAEDLTLGQAAFLAGLPQLPSVYDPMRDGLEQALRRQEIVLGLMVEDGYITQAEADQAAAEIRNYTFQPVQLDLHTAPHFVMYVRQTVESLYGAEALYRGTGLRIYTTLDRRLQALAEQAVREGVASLKERNVTNGALVAIEPSSGYIVAMVGSADFYSETIDGQVNVALRCRQPGSSIKPLTYLAAFERGWTPATLLWDLRTEFPDGANPPYVPVNYDGEYHGPMLVREALANSYNVPAVKALQFVGIDGLLEMAGRLGVASLVHPELYCPDYPYDQPPLYGLSLTLGGGETKLLEMTGAFAVFANNGVRVSPTPILRIEDSYGNILVDNTTRAGEQVVSPQHAFLITSILSDPEARSAEFGRPSVLELSRPAAAKTGTTNDFRDSWTIGYTPDLVAGVWLGNSDNSEMNHVSGAGGAGRVWRTFMEAAHGSEGLNLPVRGFVPPAGVVELEICAHSGTRPSEYCPRRKHEFFVQDQPPPGPERDWYQKVRIDAATGLLANEYCPHQVIEQVMVVITDTQGREWAQAHPDYFGGLPLAPLEYCTDSSVQPLVEITSPALGDLVQGVVPIIGTVRTPAFDYYEVRYCTGSNMEHCDGWISGPHLTPVQDGVLTQWDTTGLPSGPYGLLVVAFDRDRGQIEAWVPVMVGRPVLEPTVAPPPSPSPSPSPLPSPFLSPSPTPPIATDTPPPVTTPIPTETPVVTPTLVLTATRP